MEMCILIPEPTWKLEPYGTESKFLKFKTEIYQRIELKKYRKKMGHSFSYVYSQSHGHLNVKTGSCHVLSAGSSQNQSHFGQDI